MSVSSDVTADIATDIATRLSQIKRVDVNELLQLVSASPDVTCDFLLIDKLESLLCYATDPRTKHQFEHHDWPTLIHMASWDMCPDLFAYERNEEHVAQQDQVQLHTTDQFTCSRCKQRECVFYTAQTRAGDEGMTQYITCMKCGKNWKM